MRTNSSAGFTTLEAVIAIAIISLTGAALFGGFSVALRALSKAKQVSANAITMLAVDTKVRSALSGIKVPYWYRPEIFTETTESITFQWLDGIESASLTLEWENDFFSFTEETASEKKQYSIPGKIQNVSVSTQKDTNEQVRAIELTYTIADSDCRTVALLGSIPLLLENPQ